MYVDNNDTTINIYLAQKSRRLINFDSLPKSAVTFPQQFTKNDLTPQGFSKAIFDIDFIMLPFKHRPAKENLHRQFNTALNGAVYLGMQKDIFKIEYKKSPRKVFDGETNYYGFSYGIFTGLGVLS